MAAISHCHYCFDTLAAHLEHRKALTLPQIEALYHQQQQHQQQQQQHHQQNGTSNGHGHGHVIATPPPRPLFVTWSKLSRSGNRNLRGCIGTFDAQPLEIGLRSYALTAALDDTRFSPIALKELPMLECGVTLLTDFEPAADAMDWVLGDHGLRIAFVYHGKRMGATYLPDVPVEQGWTKEETVVSLMRKAGWTGARETWMKVVLEVVRYKGTKATVGWEEYKELVDGFGDDDEEEDEEDD